MKHKRININILSLFYNQWVKCFNEGKYDFLTYRHDVTLDEGEEFVNIGFSQENNSLKLTIKDNKNNIIFTNYFTIDFALKKEEYSFEYGGFNWFIYYQIEGLSSNKSMERLNLISETPDLYNWIIGNLSTINLNNKEELMDIAYCLTTIRFNDSGRPFLSNKQNMELLESFLNKLYYYGYEIKTIASLKQAFLLPSTTIDEVFEKEVQIIYFLLKYNESITAKCKLTMEEQSEELYIKFKDMIKE